LAVLPLLFVALVPKFVVLIKLMMFCVGALVPFHRVLESNNSKLADDQANNLDIKVAIVVAWRRQQPPAT
jgi:hypothetical protein